MPKVVFLILSYFLGAIPTAYLVGKAVKGIDIREHGSKNVGATNVFRCVGKEWGSFVLAFDILKGFVAVTLWPHVTSEPLSVLFLFVCGIIAVFGHNWTIFLRFKGGKGVATTLGILLGLFPKTVLCALAVALVTMFTTKYVSLGSILGALVFPIFFFIFNRNMDQFLVFFIIVLLMMVLIIYKHRKNIERLKNGTENKIGKAKEGPDEK